MYIPNERTTAVHVLCEKDDTKNRYQHKCSNTLLDVPLNALHHMAADPSHKAIFTVDAIIVYDNSVCTIQSSFM